ncbi:twin-arginine translocase subunit TatC [Marinibaculum pumilum]|uniref:Sec-independent protein translocase protein TatC n=1 Tax=Marinibaculum pumilum TaxID=1766165 RepID=A0ABV7KWJ5_9PROT
MSDVTKDGQGGGGDQDPFEATKMPLMDHVVELRNRLMWSVGAVIICFVIAYIFSAEIYEFLTQPLYIASGGREDVRTMIFTAPQEAFFTYIKVSFWLAMFIAFPMTATQVWMFVAPGLYKHERQAFLPFLLATPVLFFAGGAMVYFLILPLALEFFIGFQTNAEGRIPIELIPKVNEYLSLVMTLIFAFGLAFQLPVLLTLLARVGLVTPAGLAKRRKYAVVIIMIAAAVLTPPDPVSQIGLAVPLYLLYELSIISARMAEKKKAEREAAERAARGE